MYAQKECSGADQSSGIADGNASQPSIVKEPTAISEALAKKLSAEALIPEVKWQRTSDLIMAQSANALVLERLNQLTSKVV